MKMEHHHRAETWDRQDRYIQFESRASLYSSHIQLRRTRLIHHRFAMAEGALQAGLFEVRLDHSHGSHGAHRRGYWMTSRSARRGSRYLKFAFSTPAP